MTQPTLKRLLIILAVLVASLFLGFPIEKRMNLGLDLKGGMHLVLKVETEKLPEDKRNDAVLRAMEILRNRVDGMGVGETVLQRQGESEILVQLPGVTDRQQALQIINRVAHLEFRLVNDDPAKLQEALAGNVWPGYELKYIKKEDNQAILIQKEPLLQGDAIKDAAYDFDPMGLPLIRLSFNSQGAKEFAKITAEHVGERLAIVLDQEVLSAPNIQEPILNGQGQISGQFTMEEASLLALALRSGALPTSLHVEEERTIGPLLGRDSIEAGIKANIIGGALVIGFMMLYYLVGGIIAAISLTMNLVLIFGSMGFMNMMLPDSPMVLTLPGIAGIILTLGMAVDANVLINERIREELNLGRPLPAAIKAGFARALSAIVDSNLTTLIAAFMLFQFGSGPIKGFAVTLTLGLITSLFTALFVSKTLFNVFTELKIIKTLPMLQLFPLTKFDFINKRHFFYALSLIVIFAGLLNIAQKKEKAYGIDFAGGQIQEYRFSKPVATDQIRAAIKGQGIENAVIQQFDKNPENVLIRTAEDTQEKVAAALKAGLPNVQFEILRIEKVGPVVGKALRKRALLAMAFALTGILIYIFFRFKHIDFAVAAVVALLHDVLVAMGVLVMFGREIDLLVVTALLTIAGYSINDTIVIYDRVRENMAKSKQSLKELINLSVNQTLGRTVLTTSVTFLAVISLYLFGGEVLNTFALCLIIGFISGAYSTVFIASPLVLAWHRAKK